MSAILLFMVPSFGRFAWFRQSGLSLGSAVPGWR